MNAPDSDEHEGQLAAPSGTVTFLFTDIEGSTRLLEKARERYAVILSEHHDLLRAVFDRWNGHEIGTEGDAFFVAFPRALDAVNCAIEAQRALLGYDWGDYGPVRVRMGLHTGEPLIARTGYVGMDVHRAARIAHAGHGGQVLLSQTTRDLVYQDLPPDIKLRDLGAHLLKDIRLPQEIYQLDVPDLPWEFPPLKTLEKLASYQEPPAPGEPPYKGLQYFGEMDEAWFYGRQAVTTSLYERVQDERFLAVIGASGSGKSSVVRAGLVPSLKRASPGKWYIYILTPTAHPLEALAVSLTRETESVTATATLIDDLYQEPRSLHLYGQKLLTGRREKRILLLVDQFEEIFTLCQEENERQLFIANLLYAVEVKGGSITGLIALRADFYEHLAHYPELREAVSKHQEYIGSMTTGELRQAIEGPANRGGWEFSPGLVDLILHDIGAGEGSQPEPGALPLLSHALLETWKRRRGTTMNLPAYSEAGGVRGAIARTAESVYSQELTPRQQVIARSIFLRLTELGEGTQDTRRRAVISELVPPAPYGDPKDIEEVLVKLADARLITTGEGTAEVAHEALIREWPTLREWLDQNREGIRIHRHMTRTAREWDLRERDPGELYRGARLAQAQEWAQANPGELNLSEQEFLQESLRVAQQEVAEREAQRQRDLEAAQKLAETEKARATLESKRAEEQTRAAERLRQRAFLLVGALGIAAILALFAFIFARQAGQEANLAISRELAAAAVNNLEVDPERSVLLALEGLETVYTTEAENALHLSVPQMHLLRTLTGHGRSVETIAINSDGTRLATAGVDGMIIVWDATSWQEVMRFSAGNQVVFGMTFSPNGQRIITASEDQTAKVWDSTTGQQLLVVDHGAPLSDVAISPDGARLATAGADAVARIWEIESRQEILALSGHAEANRQGSIHPGGVVSIAFTPDGQRIATAGADGTVRLWDAATGQELRLISSHTNEVYLALGPDGNRLLTAGYDGQVKIWDISPGGETAESPLTINHEQPARDAAFSPDGKLVAVASQDGAARVWDAVSGQRLLTLAGHAGLVDDLAFTPDGLYLVTVAEDETMKVWDLAPGRERLTIVDGSPGEVAYSPDGRYLATSQSDGTIAVRDSATGKILLTLAGHPNFGAVSLTFSPDGDILASASWDTTAKLWDLSDGHELFTLSGHTDFVWQTSFSPDRNRLATASQDKSAKVWDTNTGQEMFTLSGHGEAVQDIAYSPDGTRIATSGECDNTARIWDAANGQQLMILDGGICLSGVAFSPDSKRLAAGGQDGSVIVWDVSEVDGQVIFKFSGHASFIPRVAFSPDGEMLASASFDGTAKVWDLTTGQERLTLSTPGPVTRAIFSPSGTDLATAGFSRQVSIWILDVDELAALARSRLTRTLAQDECQRFLHEEACPGAP